MLVHNYEKLTVWQKSMDLVELVYIMTKSFPKEEIYGITSQMKRCAISVPSNIAEGSRRRSQKDFRNFLLISMGSASELETQLKIAKRLKFGILTEYSAVESLLIEVLKMLNKLIQTIKV